MADKQERGTGLDSAWNTDLTGGNDSGTTHISDTAGNEATGPDLTARLLQGEGVLEPDKPQRILQADDNRDAGDAGTASWAPDTDPESVTDESGRVASTEPDGPTAQGGSARH